MGLKSLVLAGSILLLLGVAGCDRLDEPSPSAPEADSEACFDESVNSAALASLPTRTCPYELKEDFIQLFKAGTSWSNSNRLKYTSVGSTIPTAERSGTDDTKVRGSDGSPYYQCVDFIHCVGGIPTSAASPTSGWKQGLRVMSLSYVPTGTVVGTFSGGSYSGHTAAVYGKYPTSIAMWDQNFVPAYAGIVSRHSLSTTGSGLSDADAYYVVELEVSYGVANYSWDCIDDATPPNQTVTMKKGEVKTFRVSCKDMGSAMWSQNPSDPNRVYLAACTSTSDSSEPSNRNSSFAYNWVGGTRWKAAHPKKTASQGEYAVFDFKMKAPQTTGTYTEKFLVYAFGDGSGLWIPRTDVASYRPVAVTIRVVS